jgi:hypothetical protein
MACDNHASTENQITDEIAAIIRKMERNGINSSGPQSDILKREYGIDIPPHIIAEYFYRARMGIL